MGIDLDYIKGQTPIDEDEKEGGNGRHSRLCADILISHSFDKPVFTWGGKDLTGQIETRTKYLEAIYQADQENIKI